MGHVRDISIDAELLLAIDRQVRPQSALASFRSQPDAPQYAELAGVAARRASTPTVVGVSQTEGFQPQQPKAPKLAAPVGTAYLPAGDATLTLTDATRESNPVVTKTAFRGPTFTWGEALLGAEHSSLAISSANQEFFPVAETFSTTWDDPSVPVEAQLYARDPEEIGSALAALPTATPDVQAIIGTASQLDSTGVSGLLPSAFVLALPQPPLPTRHKPVASGRTSVTRQLRPSDFFGSNIPTGPSAVPETRGSVKAARIVFPGGVNSSPQDPCTLEVANSGPTVLGAITSQVNSNLPCGKVDDLLIDGGVAFISVRDTSGYIFDDHGQLFVHADISIGKRQIELGIAELLLLGYTWEHASIIGSDPNLWTLDCQLEISAVYDIRLDDHGALILDAGIEWDNNIGAYVAPNIAIHGVRGNACGDVTFPIDQEGIQTLVWQLFVNELRWAVNKQLRDATSFPPASLLAPSPPGSLAPPAAALFGDWVCDATSCCGEWASYQSGGTTQLALVPPSGAAVGPAWSPYDMNVFAPATDNTNRPMMIGPGDVTSYLSLSGAEQSALPPNVVAASMANSGSNDFQNTIRYALDWYSPIQRSVPCLLLGSRMCEAPRTDMKNFIAMGFNLSRGRGPYDPVPIGEVTQLWSLQQSVDHIDPSTGNLAYWSCDTCAASDSANLDQAGNPLPAFEKSRCLFTPPIRRLIINPDTIQAVLYDSGSDWSNAALALYYALAGTTWLQASIPSPCVSDSNCAGGVKGSCGKFLAGFCPPTTCASDADCPAGTGPCNSFRACGPPLTKNVCTYSAPPLAFSRPFTIVDLTGIGCHGGKPLGS